MTSNGQLLSWDEIAAEFADGLLIGNGSSLAVSASFGYGSLLGVASGRQVAHPLTRADLQIFELLNETDFERVLAELSRSAKLAEVTGGDPQVLLDRYERIRLALVEAVHAVHPRHSTLDSARFERVQDSLLHFSSIFTTNYDLLLYWAVTCSDRMNGFRDFFWNSGLSFSPSNAWTAQGDTCLYYLHGALHIFHLPTGKTVKATGGDDSPWSTYVPLLDLTFEYKDSKLPLFVSEGLSERKMAAISSNGYLHFAYTSWVEHCWTWTKSLVIFGHALGAQDEHLVVPIKDRIKKAKERGWALPKVAISVRRAGTNHIAERISYYRERLDHEELFFFDAATHPLGM